ncbi:MAG: hypothetical protein WAR21_11900 [Candidatus Acidiferrales bacterium]|jgi:hypothetical protein
MVGVFPSAFRPGPLSEFKHRLHLQVKELASELGESGFLMPVGLFPVIDKDNGGDTAAEELVRRFKLLDFESKNIVDFYFLGWRESFSGDIRFDLDTLEDYRMAFKVAGIQKFGRNADLILVDARNSAESGRESGAISGCAGADRRPVGALRMQILSTTSEQAIWAYTACRFRSQKGNLGYHQPAYSSNSTDLLGFVCPSSTRAI